MGVAQHWPMQRIQACEWISCLVKDCGRELLLTSVSRFVKVLVIEIFSSVLGLFGLIIGLLLSGKAYAFEA